MEQEVRNHDWFVTEDNEWTAFETHSYGESDNVVVCLSKVSKANILW